MFDLGIFLRPTQFSVNCSCSDFSVGCVSPRHSSSESLVLGLKFFPLPWEKSCRQRLKIQRRHFLVIFLEICNFLWPLPSTPVVVISRAQFLSFAWQSPTLLFFKAENVLVKHGKNSVFEFYLADWKVSRDDTKLFQFFIFAKDII